MADHGRAAAGLVVEDSRPPSARVVVSFFSDGETRQEAEIQPDTLMLVVEGIAAGSSLRYRLPAGRHPPHAARGWHRAARHDDAAPRAVSASLEQAANHICAHISTPLRTATVPQLLEAGG
jgi:hypothetical protein